MQYYAKITREDGAFLVQFPDCPGCFTEGNTKEEALANAHEALEGWLEAHLIRGSSPPKPNVSKGEPIAVDVILSAVLQIRWAREALGLSQGQLAAKVGVTQQQIAKLESAGSKPGLHTLQKVASALGSRLVVTLGDPPLPPLSKMKAKSPERAKRAG